MALVRGKAGVRLSCPRLLGRSAVSVSVHPAKHSEGSGDPPQYSCLENSVASGAWWAAACGVAESDTTEAA